MLNVCLQSGEHIGIAAGTFKGVLMVGLTDQQVQDEWLKFPKLEEIVGAYLDCSGFRGVQRQKLDNKLEQIWRDEFPYSTYTTVNKSLIMRHILLRDYRKIGIAYPMFSEEFAKLFIGGPEYTGYVLMYKEDLQFRDHETLVLNADLLGVRPELEILGLPPIYAQICDYPVTDIKTHEFMISLGQVIPVTVYKTHLRIQSGSVEQDVTFDIPLICSRGSALLIYPAGDKIRSLVCEGTVYNFS